ncbi:hypothetical protein HPB50_013533 [Hyalomma asiaticum]|uniref:Uncharacterized protein n=1 Tax=Hyalomma asiaticum TaxID=266040 RepID=A0ACB7RJ48_HYAAI|nr:hypothetical protein HPB50_013533 [Hyalomma asiaticum]
MADVVESSRFEVELQDSAGLLSKQAGSPYIRDRKTIDGSSKPRETNNMDGCSAFSLLHCASLPEHRDSAIPVIERSIVSFISDVALDRLMPQETLP